MGMRLRSIRLWASIGVLVIAAGMPYCAAAVGWAAIQDETTITVRADVAFGVLVLMDRMDDPGDRRRGVELAIMARSP